MGQQQLLYITLGIIVVGLAVITGINMMGDYYQENNRELLINQVTHILSKAEAYYEKPASQGGGSNSYRGFVIPSGYKNADIGTFRISANNARINIDALGTVEGRDGKKPVEVIGRINRNTNNPSGKIMFIIKN